MKNTNRKFNYDKLIPQFTENERNDIRAFYDVYKKYSNSLVKMAIKDLKQNKAFEVIFDKFSNIELEEMSKMSNNLQKEAIENNNWGPYIEYQFYQGINYAKMNLDFRSWYEVVALLRNYMRPYLFKEYTSTLDFMSALNGMNIFLDLAMGYIGEAYMKEKQDIIEREQKEVKKLNRELEKKVKERTNQLESAIKELESFSYSVSHDLRAPLRAINGFSEILFEDYRNELDENGQRIIDTICRNATKMGNLIDDLLAFSKLGRKEIRINEVKMNELTESVLVEINNSHSHNAEISIHDLNNIEADPSLIQQVMINLISNAIKYSSKKEKPTVEISSYVVGDEIVYSIKDNGEGFDMKYVDKLFGVFQRLHSQEEFEGTGVGLAIVHRIISRHNGKIWAEGKVSEGSTFSFSLPKSQQIV